MRKKAEQNVSPFSAACGKRLKKLRDEIGENGKPMTQDKMAELLCIQRQTLGHYENGITAIPLDTLNMIFLKTGCSINYILGYQESMNDELAGLKTISGLSEEALRKIENHSVEKKTIDFLLKTEEFWQIVNAVEGIRTFPNENEFFRMRSISLFIKLLQKAQESPYPRDWEDNEDTFDNERANWEYLRIISDTDRRFEGVTKEFSNSVNELNNKIYSKQRRKRVSLPSQMKERYWNKADEKPKDGVEMFKERHGLK